MKKLPIYLFGIFFLIASSLPACPDCMGKVSNQSPAFFDEDLYSSPSINDEKYYQLNPYPYEYQLSYDKQPSLDLSDDDDDLHD